MLTHSDSKDTSERGFSSPWARSQTVARTIQEGTELHCKYNTSYIDAFEAESEAA